MTNHNKKQLLKLMNLGKATYKDLELLEIHTVAELAQSDPDELYKKLKDLTGMYHDPCVWDVFAAIIHEAKTGEKTRWWEWTKKRKGMQQS